MRIKNEYSDCTAQEIWEIVAGFVLDNGCFHSITGIDYSAKFVGSCIFFKGGKPGSQRAEKGEYLTGKDFIRAYNDIKAAGTFTIKSVKPLIKRQHTPFIGVLMSAGIIE